PASAVACSAVGEGHAHGLAVPVRVGRDVDAAAGLLGQVGDHLQSPTPAVRAADGQHAGRLGVAVVDGDDEVPPADVDGDVDLGGELGRVDDRVGDQLGEDEQGGVGQLRREPVPGESGTDAVACGGHRGAGRGQRQLLAVRG